MSGNLRFITLCVPVSVDCLGFAAWLLNKLLHYGYAGCLDLLLKFVQVQVTGSETVSGRGSLIQIVPSRYNTQALSLS